MKEADKAIFDALWAKVSDDFDADEPHAKFLQHCSAANMLSEAAALYRGKKEELDGGDDKTAERIEKSLSAITLLAVAQLDVQRSEPKKRHPLLVVLTFIVVLVFIGALLGFFRALLL